MTFDDDGDNLVLLHLRELHSEMHMHFAEVCLRLDEVCVRLKSIEAVMAEAVHRDRGTGPP
jgi:hypothetical protein